MRPDPHLERLIDLAIAEDLGSGDLTTEALFPANEQGRAAFVAREPLVASGCEAAMAVFRRLDPTCRFSRVCAEGTRAKPGRRLLTVHGPLRALLSGERAALNFVRRLSGIATLASRYAEHLEGTGCRLLDTRKTTPGWRVLEKAAVRAGGGCNHRMGLFDGVMIKDNHIDAAGSIARAVAKARSRIPPTVRIEVECANLKQVRSALAAGADIIMLDNMDPTRMRRAVEIVAGRALTEASGRLDLQTIGQAAHTGVDFVSVGALTHSARSVDVAMDMLPA